MPIFDFLKGFAGTMGLVIALLTIVYPIANHSPLLYKSYLSGAKMKALRPEIAKLKEKHGERPAGNEYGANETIPGSRSKSIGRMYTGIIADTDLLCLV